MARYKKVLACKKDLYQENSPVLIRGGFLVWDDALKRKFVQMQFENLSDEVISEMTILLVLKTEKGKLIKQRYTYLGLAANRKSKFGAKTQIVVDNSVAKVEGVLVLETCFFEAAKWKCEVDEWMQVPCEGITRGVDGRDFTWWEQFFCQVQKPRYRRSFYKDVWRCSCGNVNKISRNWCLYCQKLKDKNFAVSRVKSLEKHTLLETSKYRDWQFLKLQDEVSEQREIEYQIARRKEISRKIFDISFSACVLAAAFFLMNGMVSVYKNRQFVYHESGLICNLAVADDAKVLGRYNQEENIEIVEVLPYKGVDFYLKAIGENAFRSDIYLKTVTISSEIISIGSDAFFGCENLTIFNDLGSPDWICCGKEDVPSVSIGELDAQHLKTCHNAHVR